MTRFRRFRPFRLFGVLAVPLVLVAAAALPPSPIADAAMKGDVAAVRRLITQGANVNAAQGDGMTALHWAADRGDSAMTELLLRTRANVKAVTRIGAYTPLHIAARGGHAVVVTALLKAGSDPNGATTGGATPLHLAAAAGNPDAVSALLDKGANPNARELEWGQTALIFAAEYGRAPAIRVLLKRGADPGLHTTVVNLTEQAAKDQAAARKRNEVLIAFEPEKHRDTTRAPGGADVPIPGYGMPGGRASVSPGFSMRDLGFAALAGDTAVPDAGRGGRGAGGPQPKGPFTTAQIQQAIAAGRTVLLAAASARGPVVEEVDTINGGVVGFQGAVGGVGGLTALHHAIRQGNMDAVLALLDGGADINDPTGVDRTTPLLLAAVNGQFDIAAQLVKRGANPNLASNVGLTPLYAVINSQWAPRSRFPQPQSVQSQRTPYLEVMEAMLKAGAQPNARLRQQFWYFAYNNCGNGNCGLENIDGTTPFWRAAYSVDVEAMKLLMKYGADPDVPSQRSVAGGRGGGGGFGGGRGGGAARVLEPAIDSASKAVPPGVGVFPVHCAAGVGYGNGYAGNAHRHAPDGWLPAMKYLVEELHADVNARDPNGFTPLHHAAARGDNAMILYLVSKGADVRAVSRNGLTTLDMANGPVSRITPIPETMALLEKLGAKNTHRCASC